MFIKVWTFKNIAVAVICDLVTQIRIKEGKLKDVLTIKSLN